MYYLTTMVTLYVTNYLLTRPEEPVPLELFSVVAPEHLVEAHDVARLVRQRSLRAAAGRRVAPLIHVGRPRYRRHLLEQVHRQLQPPRHGLEERKTGSLSNFVKRRLKVRKP